MFKTFFEDMELCVFDRCAALLGLHLGANCTGTTVGHEWACRQLNLKDLPRNVMAHVGASLSKNDIKSLRLVSTELCSLATACMEEMTMSLRPHHELDVGKVERALERWSEVPALSVEVSIRDAHPLLARGLLPRLQRLNLLLWGSTAAMRDEVATTMQGATRLRSAYISGVDGLHLAANSLTLHTLDLLCIEKSGSPFDFRQLSRLSNLQSLTFGHPVDSGELSTITGLTGLTHLKIAVGPEVLLRPLAHLPKLIRLLICSWEGRGDLQEDFVLSCLAGECRERLKSLKLQNFWNASAEAVQRLALCTNLFYLQVDADNLPSPEDIEPMFEGLPHLRRCSWGFLRWEVVRGIAGWCVCLSSRRGPCAPSGRALLCAIWSGFRRGSFLTLVKSRLETCA